MSPRNAVLAAPIGALLALSACSTESADSTLAVAGTNDACEIDSDIVDAGKVGFEFVNESNDVNELYVLKANGDTLGEVENVTTGTSRTLTVDLVAGDYLVRCKPGQTGDGFESTFTVTGDGGTARSLRRRSLPEEGSHLGDLGLLGGDDLIGEEHDVGVLPAGLDALGHRKCALVVQDHHLDPASIECRAGHHRHRRHVVGRHHALHSLHVCHVVHAVHVVHVVWLFAPPHQPRGHQVDLRLLPGLDSSGEIDHLRTGTDSGVEGDRRHLDRLFVMRDHRLGKRDVGLVEVGCRCRGR